MNSLNIIIMLLLRNYPVLLHGFLDANYSEFNRGKNVFGSSVEQQDKRTLEETAADTEAHTNRQQNYEEWKGWVAEGNDPEYNTKCADIQSHSWGDEWKMEDALRGAQEISQESFMASKRGREDAAKAIEDGRADQSPDVNNAGTYKLPFGDEEDPSPGQKNANNHVSKINESIESGYKKGFEEAIKEHQANQSKTSENTNTNNSDPWTDHDDQSKETQEKGQSLSFDESSAILTMTKAPDTEKPWQKLEAEINKSHQESIGNKKGIDKEDLGATESQDQNINMSSKM